MAYNCIIALILSIALDIGVPPYFALSIALEENSTLNPEAVSQPNRNGSRDLGLMQLNSNYIECFIERFWDNPWDFNWQKPFDNIYIACRLIKSLMNTPGANTFWAVAVCYNAGTDWLISGYDPPDSSINYASRVMNRWHELDAWSVQVINSQVR
jgi:soluble lytic murein transglycosylase-like protein